MSVEQDKKELVLDDVVEVFNVISGSGEIPFEEFLFFDDNTIVAGTLTDEEILAKVNEDKSLEDGVKMITKSRMYRH